MSNLTISNLSVEYTADDGSVFTALDDINLRTEPGEFVTVIGPSGCGKSTLLHCIGGLQESTSGTIRFGDDVITAPDPRRGAFVFQDYSLFPWKTVRENAAAGLRFQGVPKAEALDMAQRQLDFVGLGDLADRFPAQLSGGQQQRVAMARALAVEPRMLLMDEPFGALDEQTRRKLGHDLVTLLTEAEQSVVMITHSLDEAIFWADRIVVMSARPGRIAEEIRVDAPRPRGMEFMTSRAFQDIRVHLFEMLESPVPA
ncbi:ABC transporter ATP-binding protein [Microbacterium marinilacus]|uniref:ABC transporter ATP-binding protein n=1 Tax=Microbacterium marinilacus TaxID=415209 RepID=A0ABP7BTM6_9MICO|nr:ABC transporter ATP-binding protein [Microbacterium marinilacus]MBY0688232.1 ABC transporter ATP-binding protein [Microbacterium marinilacus]